MPRYPYVADKKMYAAMMFACKMIRENGYFNKAISTASNYYDVDKDELAQIVRQRQGAGQKAKAKPRKYKWFTCVVEQLTDCGTFFVRALVEKGLSRKSVEKMTDSYYGDGSRFVEIFIKVINEYTTQKEAEENFNADVEQWRSNNRYDN